MDFLYSHLNYVISSFVPMYLKKDSGYPIWFSRELMSLIKAKKKIHYQYKTKNRFSDYLVFTNLSSQCKSVSLKCWNNYIGKSEQAVLNDVKVFWKFITSVTALDNTPKYIYQNDSYSSDTSQIANCFADYFESVYSRLINIL